MYSTKNAAAKTFRMHNKAGYWIDHLGLKSHPEGGHFKEVYRSDELIEKSNLPERYAADRVFSTSIYFLLQQGEISAFHRIKSDETWYFHFGDPIEIFIISPEGELSQKVVGLDPGEGIFPQISIPRHHWFAVQTKGSFTLVGCSVAPGFNFEDFEIATFEKLSKIYPQHIEIIGKYCR